MSPMITINQYVEMLGKLPDPNGPGVCPSFRVPIPEKMQERKGNEPIPSSVIITRNLGEFSLNSVALHVQRKPTLVKVWLYEGVIDDDVHHKRWDKHLQKQLITRLFAALTEHPFMCGKTAQSLLEVF